MQRPGGSGSGTFIEHWTGGSSWTVVPTPKPGSSSGVTSIRGVSPNDIWAVGSYSNSDGSTIKGLILHWDGTSWTQALSPNPADDDRLDGVAASSAGSAVAVGTGQAHTKGGLPTTLALRWNGTAWTPTPSIQEGGTGTENTLLGVATIAATEAWAVGFFGPTPLHALAFHFK